MSTPATFRPANVSILQAAPSALRADIYQADDRELSGHNVLAQAQQQAAMSNDQGAAMLSSANWQDNARDAQDAPTDSANNASESMDSTNPAMLNSQGYEGNEYAGNNGQSAHAAPNSAPVRDYQTTTFNNPGTQSETLSSSQTNVPSGGGNHGGDTIVTNNYYEGDTTTITTISNNDTNVTNNTTNISNSQNNYMWNNSTDNHSVNTVSNNYTSGNSITDINIINTTVEVINNTLNGGGNGGGILNNLINITLNNGNNNTGSTGDNGEHCDAGHGGSNIISEVVQLVDHTVTKLDATINQTITQLLSGGGDHCEPCLDLPGIVNALPPVIEQLGHTVNQIVNPILVPVETTVIQTVNHVVPAVEAIVQQAVNAVTQVTTPIIPQVESLVQQVAVSVAPGVETIVPQVESLVQQVTINLTPAVETIVGDVTTQLGSTVETIVPQVESLVQQVAVTIAPVIEHIEVLPQQLGQNLSNGGDQLYNLITQINSGAPQLETAVQSVIPAVDPIVQPVVESIIQTVSQATAQVEAIVPQVAATVSPLIEGTGQIVIGQAGYAGLNWAGDAISQTLHVVTPTIGATDSGIPQVNGIVHQVGDALGNIGDQLAHGGITDLGLNITDTLAHLPQEGLLITADSTLDLLPHADASILSGDTHLADLTANLHDTLSVISPVTGDVGAIVSITPDHGIDAGVHIGVATTEVATAIVNGTGDLVSQAVSTIDPTLGAAVDNTAHAVSNVIADTSATLDAGVHALQPQGDLLSASIQGANTLDHSASVAADIISHAANAVDTTLTGTPLEAAAHNAFDLVSGLTDTTASVLGSTSHADIGSSSSSWLGVLDHGASNGADHASAPLSGATAPVEAVASSVPHLPIHHLFG